MLNPREFTIVLSVSFVAMPVCLLLGRLDSARAQDPNRFEEAIAEFQRQDEAGPPPKNGVLFVGSSSIRRWDLAKSFPDREYLNRGFGGSHISDAIHFADRIILPYRPRTVVLYAGDNDLSRGKSPERVAADFRTLVKKIHGELPATRVLFIAIKPSIQRWELIDQVRAANRLIKSITDRDSRLELIDIDGPMIGADGRPRAELFVDDGLHLTDAGYQLWVSQLRPALVEPAADLILHNGKVVTVDDAFTISEAIAIRDDRILGVGTDSEVLERRGEATKLVDLDGKMVLPGLMDSHTHPGGASMHEFDHPVPDMESIGDVLQYIKSRSEAVPEGEWIWVNQVFITRLREQRYPTKLELDQAAPDHPVVFSTGPDASVNSLALRLSGIDKDFQVTGSGIIDKDPKTGQPTGILRGGTKRYLKGKAYTTRQATEADRKSQLLALIKDYNSVGITAIADRNASDSAVRRYQELLNIGDLTVRVAVSHSLNAGDELESLQQKVRDIAAHPLCQGGTMLRIVGVKCFQDGGMLTGSAYMREPWGISQIYSITDPRYQGVLFIAKDKLRSIVRAVVDAGLQFTAHSVGDGAVHNLVDVYEDISRAVPIRQTRPCITHCNFMSEDVVRRMSRLGIVADIQPAWLFLDARTLSNQFGDERLAYFQPLKSLFEAGAIVGGGSDHMQKIGSLRSINPYNPFLGMWVTISRKAKWYSGQLHQEQALTREQAIRFYTGNNAYLMFLDEETGELTPGKLADLIVLDRDLLTCPVDAIKDTKVLSTYLGGQLVHHQ